MNGLNLNPLKHDITISCDEIQQDSGMVWAELSVRLSGDGETAFGSITSNDAHKISAWFGRLAYTLERREASYKASLEKIEKKKVSKPVSAKTE